MFPDSREAELLHSTTSIEVSQGWSSRLFSEVGLGFLDVGEVAMLGDAVILFWSFELNEVQKRVLGHCFEECSL